MPAVCSARCVCVQERHVRVCARAAHVRHVGGSTPAQRHHDVARTRDVRMPCVAVVMPRRRAVYGTPCRATQRTFGTVPLRAAARSAQTRAAICRAPIARRVVATRYARSRARQEHASAGACCLPRVPICAATPARRRAVPPIF